MFYLLVVSKPLKMNDLTLSEKSYRITYIRIICKPENIVIGNPRFLLRREVLHQICHRVSLDGHAGSVPGAAGRGGGIYACGVVNEIWRKSGVFDLTIIEIPCQLMHNRANHLQVTQFLCTRRSIGNVPKSRGKALPVSFSGTP